MMISLGDEGAGMAPPARCIVPADMKRWAFSTATMVNVEARRSWTWHPSYCLARRAMAEARVVGSDKLKEDEGVDGN